MSDGINDSHAYFEGAAIAGKSPRRQLAEMGDRHTIEASQLADSSTDVCRIAEVLAERDKRYAALQRQLVEMQVQRDAWLNYAFVGEVVPEKFLPKGSTRLPTVIETLQQQLEEAYSYGSRLFLALHPECTALPDMLGVLKKLDNAIGGLRGQLAAVSAERDAAKQSSAGLLMSFYANKCDNESLRAEIAAAIREKEEMGRALRKVRDCKFEPDKIISIVDGALASASTEEGE